MKLKAILCDFDGTLVDRKNCYNPGLKNLLIKIKSKNIYFSLATGRAFFGQAEKILADLNIFDYHIFNGGALILNNKDKSILWKQSISVNSVKKIINYLKETELNFALETINFAYVPKTIIFPTYADSNSIKNLSQLDDYSKILKIIIFAGINNITDSQIELHKKNLSRQCKDVSLIKFKFGDLYGMDITSEKATKHTAVLEYEKLLKIPRSQIVGIGDGLNDYPLFTACGYKVAMGNAPKELKEIADFIAPTVDNNGTVIALQHVIKKFKI